VFEGAERRTSRAAGVEKREGNRGKGPKEVCKAGGCSAAGSAWGGNNLLERNRQHVCNRKERPSRGGGEEGLADRKDPRKRYETEGVHRLNSRGWLGRVIG